MGQIRALFEMVKVMHLDIAKVKFKRQPFFPLFLRPLMSIFSVLPLLSVLSDLSLVFDWWD